MLRSLLLLLLPLFAMPLLAQTPLPQQVDDYDIVTNPDSLATIVYAQKDNPERYMHGLISLEWSRLYFTDKRGQDLETIKTLADQTKSALGQLMYRYLKYYVSRNVISEIAIKEYLALTELFEARKDTLGMMMSYEQLIRLNISGQGVVKGDATVAKNYYAKIIELGEKAVSLRAKLGLYLMQLRYNQTVNNVKGVKGEMAIFEKGIKIINQNPKYEYQRFLFYTAAGKFFYGKPKEFLANCLMVYQLPLPYSTAVRLINTYNLANAFKDNGYVKNAKKYYQMAIELGENTPLQHDNEVLFGCYHNLLEINLKQKDYAETLKNHYKVDSLMPIVEQETQKKNLLDIQIKYATDKKEAENKNLQLEKEKTMQRTAFLSIALILSIVVVLALVYFYQKIRTQNTELSRLNDLTNTQNQNLVAANNQMQYFTQTLSHDVLGYINNILNFLTIAEVQNTQAPVQTTLQKIIHNVKHLKSMSENLIQYSRLKQSVRFNNIDLNQALKDVLENFPTDIINLDSPNLPIVYANYEFIEQIFHNLINNALRYKKPDTPLNIHILARPAEQTGFVEIEIRDNGIGIDADKLTTIFDQFKKGTNSTEGTGLGLFICRQIVESGGGNMWANSEKGVGTSFYFTLPMAKKGAFQSETTPA